MSVLILAWAIALTWSALHNHHDAAGVGCEDRVGPPAVEGGLEGHLVVGGEAARERFERLARGRDARVAAPAAVRRQPADLEERLVDIEPVEHDILLRRESRESGCSTRISIRARSASGWGRRAARYNPGLEAHTRNGRPRGLPASPGTPTFLRAGFAPAPGGARGSPLPPRRKCTPRDTRTTYPIQSPPRTAVRYCRHTNSGSSQ